MFSWCTVTVLLYTPTYQQELKVLVQRILLHFLAFYCLNFKKHFHFFCVNKSVAQGIFKSLSAVEADTLEDFV